MVFFFFLVLILVLVLDGGFFFVIFWWLILNMCDFSGGCRSNEISQGFRRGVFSLLICWLRRIGIDNDVRVAASEEVEVPNGVHQELMQ